MLLVLGVKILAGVPANEWWIRISRLR
jgi:hypothetical protein